MNGLTDADDLWAAVTARQLTGGKPTVPAALVLEAIKMTMQFERLRAKVGSPQVTLPTPPKEEPPPALGPSVTTAPEHDLGEHEEDR
jgi:hypothetical protein